MSTETETAFTELLDEVAATHRRMVEALADDPTTLLEAHKWLLSILQVATDVNLWADTDRPRFVEIVGPTRSGVATTPTPSTATLRSIPPAPTGSPSKPGDAVYLSLTVYGDLRRALLRAHRGNGQQPRRHLAIRRNDRHRAVTPRPERRRRLLDPARARRGRGDHRDYLEDPVRGRRAVWHIEADDPPASFARTTPTWPGASGP